MTSCVRTYVRTYDDMMSSTHVVGCCRSIPIKLEFAGLGKMVYVRVRLRFDSSPLHYAKKCWFVFDADQCSLVKDVAYLIARQFGLTQGIQVHQLLYQYK